MALSNKAKEAIRRAVTEDKAADELIAALESAANEQAASVALMGATSNLPAVPGSFADLAAARTAVDAQRTAVEARLDAIEAKMDATLQALKDAGLMA